MNLYKQGYVPYNNTPTIKSMSTCPSVSFQQNTLHTLTLNASSGTPPYTYHWAITKPDGTIDTDLPNQPIISYIFDQLTQTRNYTVSAYAIDSCPVSDGGPKITNIETCSISVTTAPLPTCIPQPDEVNIGGVCVKKSTVVVGGVALTGLVLMKYYNIIP